MPRFEIRHYRLEVRPRSRTCRVIRVSSHPHGSALDDGAEFLFYAESELPELLGMAFNVDQSNRQGRRLVVNLPVGDYDDLCDLLRLGVPVQLTYTFESLGGEARRLTGVSLFVESDALQPPAAPT